MPYKIKKLTYVVVMVTLLMRESTANPLPFEDGMYTTSPDICEYNGPDELLKVYGDYVGVIVRNIQGDKLDNSYEMSCEISNVRRESNLVRFSAICEQEGEESSVEATYVYLSKNSFRLGKRVFTKCGEHQTPKLDRDTVAPHIRSAYHLEDLCRGSRGSHPNINQFCDARDKSFELLNILGWCYGREGQSGAEYQWHQCAKDSQK